MKHVWRFEGKLFLELARARDRLRRELRANVVACVFFADPDPDELDRLRRYIVEHSVDERDGLVFNPVTKENNLFVFYGSRVALDAELRAYEADADATEDRVRAAIALAEARLEGNLDIRAPTSTRRSMERARSALKTTPTTSSSTTSTAPTCSRTSKKSSRFSRKTARSARKTKTHRTPRRGPSPSVQHPTQPPSSLLPRSSPARLAGRLRAATLLLRRAHPPHSPTLPCHRIR
mmetsp:Transcript_4335/g.17566  ORF Transcript_4335/g.17566 Transcript_4335/m.17566 type:complete len:235 (+) Transcript_4335:566-1270(+)